MNKETITFWEDYKEKTGQYDIKATAWQFGFEPDELLQLVIDGKKTATCSWYRLYEIEGEPLPQVGLYQIILNSEDRPVVIIKTTQVILQPMDEVPIEFALSEGEGDGTFKYWWEGHLMFFNELANEFEIPFTTQELLVCETFEVVKINSKFINMPKGIKNSPS